MGYVIVFALFLMGCSVDPGAFKDAPTETPAPTPVAAQAEVANFIPVRLEGHISGAFEIVVDGESYADTETYYTEQLTFLEKQAVEHGYEGYEVAFDISVGSSFFRGTQVHAQSEGGFSADSRVDQFGEWGMDFPAEADGQTFNLRSVKRVSVTLTKEGEEKVHWCHNMVGQAKVTVVGGLNAANFTEFESRLTKYECQDKKRDFGPFNSK